MDPSGPVSLRWHQFSTNLCTTSSMLRESNILTDITFIVEEKQVVAHKFILASSSPLFLSLLQTSSHPHPMVYLRGVSYRDLTSLLDFMYKGEVNVEQRYLESFLNTAEELKVKGLSENGNDVDDSKGVGEHEEEIGDDKDINIDEASNVNVLVSRDESEQAIDCLEKIEEMEKVAPLACDSNQIKDQDSEMNTSASSSLASFKADSNHQKRVNKVKQTPAKAKRKSFNSEPKKKYLEERQLKSPVEESQSLSAKRSSLYGKKLTEEWKTDRNNKTQLSKKPKGKNIQKQTNDCNKSEKPKGKRNLSDEDVACQRLKYQRRLKNSKLKAGAESGVEEIPGVSDKQKAVSARLEFAIIATKEEIKKLEGVKNVDDIPSTVDATDGTIAEVEKVLKLSQEVLGDFDYVDNADDNEDLQLDMNKDVSDPSSGNVSQINQSPGLSPNLRSDKSNYISSEVRETSPISSSENILTPVKKMAIISLMLVKGNSNSVPWKCSICKKLFKSKSSAEEHIELEHVEGKLQ